MSSSLSSIDHIDYEIDEQRDGQAEGVTRSPVGIDNSPQETGIRRKLKRFWKRTRISSMVKKVVVGSKSLFSLIAPRQPQYANPSEPVQRGETNATPRVERVKFPEDMIPSPASSSNAASPSASIRTPALDIYLNASIPTNSSPTPIPLTKVNNPIIIEQPTPSENDDEQSFGDYRYKEKPGKQKSFPEIKVGVVNSRVKWLEPLFSGEKADDKNQSRKDDIFRDAPSNKTETTPQVLEIHASSGLAPGVDTGSVEKFPNSSEPDDKSVFDDSPRLFKHRLPEEEPKPWVEPGTVANGARWLQPVMSGEKRTSSEDSDPGNLTSPTRILGVVFRQSSGEGGNV